MGMKSAACWLAQQWSVRTKAMGETIERRSRSTSATSCRTGSKRLDIRLSDAPANNHYTELILEGLHKIPQGRTVSKIKEHLASIYRIFLRGVMDFGSTSDPLSFQEPAVLLAAYYRTPAAEPVLWRKEIDFDFGEGQRATGFAALREKASVSAAGSPCFAGTA